MKPYPVEERLAIAVHNYVRACRAVRLAVEPSEEKAARLLRADRRKLVGNADHTFRRLGGDVALAARHLDGLLLPVLARRVP